jgi:predicted nucleotidyltransferase component of viral defense system
MLDQHIREENGIHFYIRYTGPLGGQGHHKSVKVDISRSELLVFEPVKKPAILPYTDLVAHKLFCYTLEEVLVEKMRSVMQRMVARDFYDLWYLLEVHGLDITFYQQEFGVKCKHKNLLPTNFPAKIAERLPQYKGRWEARTN